MNKDTKQAIEELKRHVQKKMNKQVRLSNWECASFMRDIKERCEEYLYG
jgi:hypothetical protein